MVKNARPTWADVQLRVGREQTQSSSLNRAGSAGGSHPGKEVCAASTS
jgi:hypothetical protein